MTALVGKRVRATQPQQNPQIDWNNPITAGLAFAYTCANEAMGFGEDGRNLIQYLTPTPTVTGVPVNTPTGTGVRTNSGVTYSFQCGQSSIKTGAYSLFAFGTGAASGTQSAIDDDDGTTRRFQFRTNAGKVELIPFYSGGNGGVTSPVALSATELGKGFAMGGVVNGTSYAIFQNGAKTAATLSGAALTPNSLITIGARKSGTQQWLVGGLMLVAAWNRALTDAEMVSLSDNPWQLFKPAPRRLWLAYSASVGTNITPGAGALALAGYAPTIAQSANQAVVPDAGTLTMTGYAPSVAQTANVGISPASGSLTLTGYAPTVSRTASQGVQPGAGGLTLTGYAPLITQGVDNAPRVNAATIMRITTTNRTAPLGAAANASAPIRSTGPNVATILSARAVNRTAEIGPATINRTASFP